MQNDLRQAIETAALYDRHDISNREHPAEIDFTDKVRVARAQRKARSLLDSLAANDPDFAGLALTTDKLFAYVPPPQAYYRAVVDAGIGVLQLTAMRELSSGDLRAWLQRKVQGTGYAVPRNCCNKSLYDWQLQDIAAATGANFDKASVNSLTKLQAYAQAISEGSELGTPFRLSGYISDTAVCFVDGCKPGRHKLFKTSTGYPVFKRCGRKLTMQTFRAIIGE